MFMKAYEVDDVELATPDESMFSAGTRSLVRYRFIQYKQLA